MSKPSLLFRECVFLGALEGFACYFSRVHIVIEPWIRGPSLTNAHRISPRNPETLDPQTCQGHWCSSLGAGDDIAGTPSGRNATA